MIMLEDVWSHDKGERKSKTSLVKCCGSSVPGIALPPRNICQCPRNLLVVPIWEQCQWNLVGTGKVSQKSLQDTGHPVPKNCPVPVFVGCAWGIF